MALAGVDPYISGSKQDLLNAIATAGSAGEKAYNDAAAQATNYKQQAIANAGKGFSGSADLVAQLQAQSATPFDRRLSDIGAAKADNSTALANMQARNDNYLTNVGAAQGTLQALNANKLADEEFRLKAIQASLNAKAQQDAADRATKAQSDADAHNLALARIASTNATSASKAAASAKPTAADLFGGAQDVDNRYGNSTLSGKVGPGGQTTQGQAGVNTGNWVTDDVMMNAQDEAAYAKNGDKRYSPDPMVNLAHMVGQAQGLSDSEVNSLLTPAVINSYVNNTTTKSSEDTIANSLASKYAARGVTPDLAKSVINNTDFKADVQNILSGAGGASREAVDAAIQKYYVKDRGWNSEYEILKGEYLPMLPTQAQLNAQGG